MTDLIEQFLIAALLTQYKDPTCAGCKHTAFHHAVGCMHNLHRSIGWGGSAPNETQAL